jgi:hypothetical protein
MHSSRYWMWLLARLLVGAAIVTWAVSYLTPGDGEKEFQKTLAAMKHVHSFRSSFSGSPGTQHNELQWEVDCDRNVLHEQTHFVDTAPNPPVDLSLDEIRVADRTYRRASDGSWASAGVAYQGATAKWFSGNIAAGTDSNLLPPIATMIRRGVIQKGDKKTVNGVSCREWLVTMKNGTANLAHDAVCLGLDDHLPYELTVDWERSRSTFSDYNTPLQIDMPEAALQSTSANESN